MMLIKAKREMLAKGWSSLSPLEREHVNHLGREITKQLPKDMEVFIESLCEEVDAATKKGDTKTFHEALKSLQNKHIERAKSNKIDPQIMKDHFQQVLNPNIDTNHEEKREELITQNINRIMVPKIDNNPPSMEEVQLAINSLKRRRVVGTDNIPAEILQSGGTRTLEALHKIIGDIWSGALPPDDWLTTTITPLYKGKGSLEDPNSYRGISLQSHCMKVLCEIIKRRLDPLTEAIVGEYQCGFRAGRSTQDAIFVYRLMSQRARSQGVTLHSCFIDLIKAFDTCDWQVIFTSLEALKVPKEITNILKTVYRSGL